MLKKVSGCDAMGLAVYGSPKIENVVVVGEKHENVDLAVQKASGVSETIRN